MTRAFPVYYCCRVLELLRRYYQGELASLDEDGADGDSEGAEDGGRGSKGGKGKARAASGSEDGEEDGDQGEDGAAANGGGDGNQLLTERIAPRKGLPPLLVSLTDRKPERLHYLGGLAGGGDTGAYVWGHVPYPWEPSGAAAQSGWAGKR